MHRFKVVVGNFTGRIFEQVISAKRISILFSFCILYFIVYALNSCTNQQKKTDQVPRYASLSDSTHYVGMASCRQCHEDKYQSYIRTGMGLSFDSASHQKSSAGFDHAPLYDHLKDFYYKPFWSGDSLYLMEYRLKGTDTVHQRTERISYIIGSGQHTNSHLMNVNGYVTQVPATFYTQSGKWDLPPGFENGFNSRFSRKIGLECMSCHNAFPAMVKGSENKYTHLPDGIDCERCHGPGSEHIRQRQAGVVVDVGKEIDYTIVNPAKLPIELQLDVCQRCHIQGNAVLKDEKSFYDFRPGMKLSEVMDVYMPVYKGGGHEQIMASHVERMKLSACFIESGNKAERMNPNKSSLFPYRNAMTCVTCHNPHVSVRETGSEQFNSACMSCHGTSGEKTNPILNEVAHSDLVCTENVKSRMTVNDNCVHCHMPRNSTLDIPHVSVTDHHIRKPLKSEEVNSIKEFVTLACINNPKADRVSRGVAFLNYFEKFEPGAAYLLDSAAYYFPGRNAEGVRADFKNLVRLAYLKNDFQKVIDYAAGLDAMSLLHSKSYSNEDAWTSYRIGEAYLAAQNITDAIKYFQNSVNLAAYHPDFRNKLAQAQLESGRKVEARKNLEFIIQENPGYASAYVSLGYLILSVDNNIKLADSYYDKALSLDPDHEQALYNKAGTLMYQERKKEAINMLQRLLKKNPVHPQGKALLKTLMNT